MTAPHVSAVLGWDIGGVNTKGARVASGRIVVAASRPYEVQRDPAALPAMLRTLAAALGGDRPCRHALTMTAELSQMFRRKREGVDFVINAVEAAFPGEMIRVFTVAGNFLTPTEARRDPLAVAAANWAATATVIALVHPDALLVDIGTTTTDVIPVVGGRVAAVGRSDPTRLASGELVYTGVVRTPVEAIVRDVPLGSGRSGVSAEAFALAGDVHVWRGSLDPADYAAPTPDGRPATREYAGERLARVVCADREMLDEAALTRIADAVADAQIARIAESIARVRARHPAITHAVVTGLGDFVAAAAARRMGLQVEYLHERLGGDAARAAPAAAVALLLERAAGDAPAPP